MRWTQRPALRSDDELQRRGARIAFGNGDIVDADHIRRHPRQGRANERITAGHKADQRYKDGMK